MRLADAIKIAGQQSPAQPLITDGIGVVTLIRQTGGWVVRVSGLLQEPIELTTGSMSQPFIDHLTAAGAGINGRRVKVDFVNRQPIIAYALGDDVDATQ